MPESVFLSPKSIAIIGASDKRGSVGRTITSNIMNGFKGIVFPISPTRPEVFYKKAYKSVLDVPKPIDLAVIVTKNTIVPDVLEECGKKKVKGVIIGACNVGNNSAYLRAVALGLGLPVYAPNDYLNIGRLGGQSVRVGDYSGFTTGPLLGKGFRGFDPSTGEFTVRQWWQLQLDSNSP